MVVLTENLSQREELDKGNSLDCLTLLKEKDSVEVLELQEKHLLLDLCSKKSFGFFKEK